MTQFSSVEEYNRSALTERRLKQNRKIDAIVENSLKGTLCDCGSENINQKKRGTYIVLCNSCKTEYKI
jgi:hypothetical protein